MLGLNQWLWTITHSSAEICAQVGKEEKRKDAREVDSRRWRPGLISQHLTRDEESLCFPTRSIAAIRIQAAVVAL